MRFFYFLTLLIVLAALVIFAVQNNEAVTLRYLDRSVTSSMPVLIAVVYLLGMVSGWTVVGFLKRSLQRVTARREN
jgi:lipopolysaccharide assembly protein A